MKKCNVKIFIRANNSTKYLKKHLKDAHPEEEKKLNQTDENDKLFKNKSQPTIKQYFHQ